MARMSFRQAARGGGVVVQGADVVAAAFMLAAKNVNERLKTDGRKVAEAIAETQRQLVPARTGQVRDSINVDDNPEWVESDKHQGDALYAVGPDHFVGRFLELGTVKMAPRPFVFPSADLHEGDWADVARNVAEDV